LTVKEFAKGVVTKTTITKRPHDRETAPKNHQEQDTLSCTVATTRPTLNVSLICSHQEVIIAKEKERQAQTRNQKGKLVKDEFNLL